MRKLLLLAGCLLMIISCRNSEKAVEVTGVKGMSLFPVKEFNLVSEVRNEDNSARFVYEANNKQSIIYLFNKKNPTISNGVYLLDSNGNTLSVLNKDAETDTDLSFIPEVPCEGDLNHDGKTDYYSGIYTRGGGNLSDIFQYVLFLSDSEGYKVKSFRVMHGGRENLVKFQNTKECYIIVRNAFQMDISIPVLAPEEMPLIWDDAKKSIIEVMSEEGRDPATISQKEIMDAFHSFIRSDMLFYIYYPVKISATDLITANSINKQFPLIESFGIHNKCGSKGQTKLLTVQQREYIWKEDVEAWSPVLLVDKNVIKVQ